MPALSLGMTNLKTLSTADLVARLASLETAVYFAKHRSPQQDELLDAWIATRDELNTRPTSEVLAVA